MSGSHSLGKRILSLTLCALCVLTLALPASALTVALSEEAGIQTEPEQDMACIVHSYPSAGGLSIGYFENGTQLTVLSASGSYYMVDCYGMYGYIAGSQVECRADGEYYVNCEAGAADTKIMEYVELSELLQLRHALLRASERQLGIPYVYGGTNRGGFDCSGLMYYLYGQYGYSLARGSSGQFHCGVIVSKESLQLGDLVFFRVPGEEYLTSHVGIYVGNNQIIHAGSNGVSYANLDGFYFGEYYVGARRVVSAAPIQIGLIAAAIPGAAEPMAINLRLTSEVLVAVE